MKRKGRNRERKSAITYFGLYLIMISTILMIAYGIIQLTLEQNVKNKAFDELKAKVQMQVTMLEEIINREYVQLRVINSILAFSNGKIATEQFDHIWELMREEENITMLGLSDLSGNVIKWNGEKLGNISSEEHIAHILSAGGDIQLGNVYCLRNRWDLRKQNFFIQFRYASKGNWKELSSKVRRFPVWKTLWWKTYSLLEMRACF